jgi:hypothetical protein
MAKPPDLPAKYKIDCAAPVPVAQFVESTAEECDLHACAERSCGLRTLQRCLLFAVHPLLSLLPPEELFGVELGSVDVDVEVQETSAGSLLFGVGVNSDAGLSGTPQQTERSPDEPQAMDSFFPGGFRSLRGFAFRGAGQEMKVPCDSTCPYVRQQAAAAQTPVCSTPLPGNVLENMDKLEEARQTLEQADHCRRTGHLVAACHSYEQIHRLCPGSRYDQSAMQHLSEIRSELASRYAPRQEKPSAEEAEAAPVASQVATLMQQYQMFFKQGMYSEAQRCAVQARALDPECAPAAAAIAIVKMVLQQQALTHSATPSCPMREPELPQVDPHLAGDMDVILIEAGETPQARHEVHVEETSSAEEQSVPVLRSPDVVCPCMEVEITDGRSRGRFHFDLGFASCRGSWDLEGRLFGRWRTRC